MKRPLRAAAAALLLVPASFDAQTVAHGASAYAWVDTVFREHDGMQPGCTVGATRDGRTLFARSYGMAELSAGRAATPGTMYGIASVAKQFTAMAVVLLAQEGRLTLDDDVRRWIPELPSYGTTITLRHLLTHTSGVRDFMNLLAMARGGSPAVTDAGALATIVRQRALSFTPGTDWAYSNSGYVLLAEVVRRASGMPLPELARRRILEPLGMSSTTFDAEGAVDPRLATGYVRSGGGWAAAHFPVYTTGDGKMTATVEDLLRWAEGLRTGRVGSARATETMETAAALGDGTPLHYGLGVEIGMHRGARTVSHGGAGGGFRAELLRIPAQAVAIAVLCNASTAPADLLALRVADGLLDAELSVAEPDDSRAQAPARAEDLSRFAGVYASRSGVVRTFIADTAGFRMRVPPGVDRTLVPLGDARVRVLNSPVVYRLTPGVVHTETPGAPRTTFQYLGPAGDTLTHARRYVGRYRSADLDATWELLADDQGGLRVAHGSPGSPERALRVFRDVYLIPYGLIRFTTDCRGEVDGLTISEERVQGLRFEREGSGGDAAECSKR